MNNLTLHESELTLSALLEALLFVAPTSVTPAQLASALDLPVAETISEPLIPFSLSKDKISFFTGL